MENFYKVFEKRATVRSFVPGEKIKEEVISRWSHLAATQPTSSNAQQFSFIVIQDEETKREISKLCWGQQQIIDAGVFYLFVADQRKYIKAAEMNNVDPIYLDSFDSIITSVGDTFIAAQTITMAAELEGYGSCYVGAVRGEMTKIKELLNLPEYTIPITGLCVGHVEKNSGVKPKNLEGIIHQEKYDLNKVNKSVENYDKIMVEYFIERGAKDRSTWTDRIARTYTSIGGAMKHGGDAQLQAAWPRLKK